MDHLTVNSMELESLLCPVNDDSPTGADLRVDSAPNSEYHRLREMRTVARNNERAALAEGLSTYISPADWMPVLQLAPQVLSDSSKDLEVASWLIEALVRCNGLRGFAQGYEMVTALLERYGPQLYPLPDADEGASAQLAPLIGLNGYGSDGALIAPLKAILVTEGSSTGPFAVWQCELALEISRISDPAKRQARQDQSVVSKDAVDRAISESSTPFLQNLSKELDRAIAVYEAFQQAVDRYCTSDPQPTAKIHDTLVSIRQLLTYIAGDRLRPDSLPGDEFNAAEAEHSVHAASQGRLPGGRSEALERLQSAAAYFRRAEPHSPVSYAIERAIYWAELSLPELMRELITDQSALERFESLSGVPAQRSE